MLSELVTCDGCPTHQVCVGEVQRSVEHEVGLHDPSHSLAGIIEESSAAHGHSALIAVLQGVQNVVMQKSGFV